MVLSLPNPRTYLLSTDLQLSTEGLNTKFNTPIWPLHNSTLTARCLYLQRCSTIRVLLERSRLAVEIGCNNVSSRLHLTVATLMKLARLFMLCAPRKFSRMQHSNNERSCDERSTQEGDRYEPFPVFRRLNLLPNKERQPGLQNVRHLIHCRDDDGPLFVIVSTYFMSPTDECR
jgi:hypothetical protein